MGGFKLCSAEPVEPQKPELPKGPLRNAEFWPANLRPVDRLYPDELENIGRTACDYLQKLCDKYRHCKAGKTPQKRDVGKEHQKEQEYTELRGLVLKEWNRLEQERKAEVAQRAQEAEARRMQGEQRQELVKHRKMEPEDRVQYGQELQQWREELGHWRELLYHYGSDDDRTNREKELGLWEEELRCWEWELLIKEVPLIRWDTRRLHRLERQERRENLKLGSREDYDMEDEQRREAYEQALQRFHDDAKECHDQLQLWDYQLREQLMLFDDQLQGQVQSVGDLPKLKRNRSKLKDVQRMYLALMKDSVEGFLERERKLEPQEVELRRFVMDISTGRGYGLFREVPGTLSLLRFQDLHRFSKISLPLITEDDIKDRSKGDLISKTIFVLQMAWFAIQCLARGWQHITLTEVELVTLAIAIVNVAICYFWLDKPLGVQYAVPLYLSGQEPAKLSPRHNIGLVEELGLLSSEVFHRVGRYFADALHDEKGKKFYPLRCITLLPLKLVIYKPIRYFGIASLRTIQTTAFDPYSDHPPMFYAPPVEQQQSLALVFVILPFVAVLFGGIHCFAWNFTYPTPMEQTLWRIGSVVITVAPIPLILGYAWNTRMSATSDEKTFTHKFFERLLSALLTLYLLARLMLLYFAIALLRKQPESAYIAVDWSRFLPHL